MYKHRILIISGFFLLCLVTLWWTWIGPEHLALQTEKNENTEERWEQDLNGSWHDYSTLNQAWQKERGEKEESSLISDKQGGQKVTLPSNGDFKVLGRKFTIDSTWSARTTRLIINGLEGRAAVYVNGVDGEHCIGEVGGNGVSNILNIASPYLKYGTENTLFIRALTDDRLPGWLLKGGQHTYILGNIYLDAVPQTALSEPEINYSWEEGIVHLHISTKLLHYSLMDKGPWTVKAIISDASGALAQQTVQITANGADTQDADLDLDLTGVTGWSPANPYLYDLDLSVFNELGSRDALKVSFGLKSIKVENGKIFVQGEAIQIRGIALSKKEEQVLRSQGQIENWLQEQLNQGNNAVYFLDQFPDQVWLNAADRLGMGVWAEFPNTEVLVKDLPGVEENALRVQVSSRHPCLWGWVAGRGILGDAAYLSEYMKKAEKFVSPQPAYLFNPVGISNGSIIVFQGNQVKGEWGEFTLSSEGQAQDSWQGENAAAITWAVLMTLIAFANFRAVSWRYKEINEVKPKRRLRQAWRWHSLALIGRAGTIGGIITSLLYNLPNSLGGWFAPHPLLTDFTRQSPWLIWAALSFFFLLLRWLQVGVAAPFMPENPDVMGLCYWLERRYRWLFMVALLWAATGWGLPIYIPLVSYAVLSLLFLPVRIRDVHKAGGKLRGLAVVPLVFLAVIAIFNLQLKNDWYYLYLFFRS